MTVKNIIDLKKNLKKDCSGLKVVKVALLGDSATQLLAQALRGYGYDAGLNLELFEAGYDQIERQVFDRSSGLYHFHPEWAVLFNSTHTLIKNFYTLGSHERSTFAEHQIALIQSLYESISSQQQCKVIYYNFAEINDGVFGNYCNKVDTSFTFQLRKLNYQLMELSQRLQHLFICDISALHNRYGESFVCDSKLYITAGMVFSIDFLPHVAKNTVDIIHSASGKFTKCLILDLDNVLWGGIIGDDGLENIQLGALGIGKAFTELQLWAKQLKQRGIILAVCSKNEEHLAKEPFEKHPDMVLTLDDIAVFVANWGNKVDNIRYIQSILNIGFDSLVFLDDSPFERSMVRTHIPDITVPELPDDPAEYLSYLRSLNLFETASYTPKDAQRTQHYQEEAKRRMVQKSFRNEDEFLASLAMTSTVKCFDRFTIPRVAQLTQRSNQFNLRTIRYTEGEVDHIAHSKDYFTLAFTLQDKFGDYGLISALILKTQTGALFIDTWIMSCRVLKRGMEYFVLNHLVSVATQHGYKTLIGEYIPTAKNELVKDHYLHLGFHEENGLWILASDTYKAKKSLITLKE